MPEIQFIQFIHYIEAVRHLPTEADGFSRDKLCKSQAESDHRPNSETELQLIKIALSPL